MSKRHNRRQRKKLHLGEFKELGFEVSATLTRELDADQRDELLDAFLEECIEAHGMLFGGGINETLDGFIVADAVRGSATEEQRAIVQEWVERRPEFQGAKIGPLVDAHYGFD